MAKAVPAIAFMSKPTQYRIQPVCVSFGKDPFLRREVFRTIRSLVLRGEDAEFSLTKFNGGSLSECGVADYRELFHAVRHELSTVAMFGSDTRLVVVDDADAFISANLRELEEYTAKPVATGILLLLPGELAPVSKFYQAVLDRGLLIDARADSVVREQIPSWLVEWSGKEVGLKLPLAAAEVLVEMVGDNLGLLDQELRKLSVSIAPGATVTPETIRKTNGTWRTRQVWDLVDTILGGDVPGAMRQLDQLLLQPEATPIGILAATSVSLRKFAVATRMFIAAEAKAGNARRVDMNAILEDAGFNRYFIGKCSAQMMKLGRRRGLKISEILLQADSDLKGASRADPRLILERVIVEMGAPARR